MRSYQHKNASEIYIRLSSVFNLHTYYKAQIISRHVLINKQYIQTADIYPIIGKKPKNNQYLTGHLNALFYDGYVLYSVQQHVLAYIVLAPYKTEV
jgi:hypothetical protein